jgi:hypothetical protein
LDFPVSVVVLVLEIFPPRIGGTTDMPQSNPERQQIRVPLLCSGGWAESGIGADRDVSVGSEPIQREKQRTEKRNP